MIYRKIMKNLFFIIFLMIFLYPKTTYADSFSDHDSYMLIPQIDETKNKFTFDVKFDSNAFGKTFESKGNINWSSYLNTNSPNPSAKGLDLHLSIDENNEITANSQTVIKTGMENNNSNKVLTFSFPAKKNKDSGLFLNKGATAGDQQRAYDIGEKLSNNLNSMLTAMDSLDGVKNITNIINLYEGVNEIRPSEISSTGEFITKDVLNVTIYYGTDLNAVTNGVPQGNPTTGELYAYIIPNGKELDLYSSKFTWAMLKGYLYPDGNTLTDKNEVDSKKVLGKSNPTYIEGLSNTQLKGGNPSDDAVWITIFNMADVAVYSAYGPEFPTDVVWSTITKVGTANSSKVTSGSSWIEDLISSIVRTFFLGIKSLLGLDSIHDLVYNGGIRGTNSYESGLMNNNWWSVMLKYHIIFQMIAWMSIVVAIGKILLDFNLSTINPRTRLFLMEIIQKLFVIGFLLVLCIPIIKLLSTLNNLIVAVFQTQSQSESQMLQVGIGGVGGTLASIFVYASYFGILCVINCTYIMRSIFIAILAASAPLFIISMAFSKGQGLFTTWIKEITANIFLQSIHAFCLAFLFEVIDNGKFIEVLVVYFSLLPITEMFRGLVFGNAGGMASSQGAKLGNTLASTTKDWGKNIANGALNTASNRMQRKHQLNMDSNLDSAKNPSTSGANKGQPSGIQALGKTFADRSSQQKLNGDTKGARTSANLGKALGATGNLLSTVDGIGEMAFQSNIGNHGGAIDAGKQIGRNIGEASQQIFDYGAQGAGMAGSFIKGGASVAASKIDSSLSGNPLYSNAKNSLQNAQNNLSNIKSSVSSSKAGKAFGSGMDKIGQLRNNIENSDIYTNARHNMERYQDYSNGLRSSLNSEESGNLAQHNQFNGDVCYKVKSSYIDPSTSKLTESAINDFSNGNDFEQGFVSKYKDYTFDRTRDGHYMFNETASMKRMNQRNQMNSIPQGRPINQSTNYNNNSNTNYNNNSNNENNSDSSYAQTRPKNTN